MTNRKLLVGLAMLLAVAGCSGKNKSAKGGDSPVDRIPVDEAVIVFRDKQVSGAWLRNWCGTQEVMLQASGPLQADEYSLIKAGMQLLTKMLLVSAEAERRGLKVDNQEIEARLSKEMSQFESTEAWMKRLEASGSSREKRREELRIELLVEKYEKEILTPEVLKTQATEEHARAFYDKFPNLFMRPNSVHAYMILRTVAKDAPESERQREKESAEKARQRVLAGEKFEDVARETSTDTSAASGGDIKVINDQMAMPPTFKEALFKLKNGEVSAVTESPLGFGFFKATEVQPAGQLSFEEVKAGVLDRLLKEGLKRAMARTSQDLQAQAMAKNELQWLDLKQYIGEPPAPQPGQPEGAAAPAAPSPAASKP
ncbi:MAG: peptidyl-prolyl cis-trans isomerase [Acidobacteriota bacterium]